MIRVIMGKKGSGKTKNVIEMINSAVQTEHGNVVCIEKACSMLASPLGEKLLLPTPVMISLLFIKATWSALRKATS